MAWKSSVPWFGAVATLAAGYVWARWARGQRAGSPRGSQLAPLVLELDELDEITEEDLLPVALERMARDDARRALETSQEGDDLELDPPQWDDPDLDDLADRITTVESTEQMRPSDEPYDAVDAEDVGSAWLRRATQMEPLEEADPNDVWGTQVLTPPELDGSRREASYGRDREGAPLAPHAGTHEDDVAAELPVGTLDDSGNAELHAPVNPPDGFDAPPTGELSVTDEEMARRAAAEAERLRSRR
jgi:hypothetical protein